MSNKQKKRLGVFKFASCDGCQLSLLSCEDELLGIADQIDIAYFLEASSRIDSGPFDLALVEGSISTNHDLKRIQIIRDQSKKLVTIGACATSGGIQSLRNWADSKEYLRYVYAKPEFIDSLKESTPVSDHVRVDFELRGCPIDKGQLMEVMTAMIGDRRPNIPSYSVCMECKMRGTVCVAVSNNQPCIGPITQAGCGAICPAFDRPCFGCFGPAEDANCAPMSEHYVNCGASHQTMIHQLRNFNAATPVFQIESDRIESLPRE